MFQEEVDRFFRLTFEIIILFPERIVILTCGGF